MGVSDRSCSSRSRPSRWASYSIRGSFIRVLTGPGQMQFTVIPLAAVSIAVGPHQPHDGVLAGGVGGSVKTATAAVDRGNSDHPPPTAFEHVGQHGFGENHGGGRVDLHCEIPEVLVELDDGLRLRTAADARVVHEDVDRAEFACFTSPASAPRYALRSERSAGNATDCSAAALNFLDHTVEFILAAGAHGDGRPLGRQLQRNRPPNSTSGAGDQRDSVSKFRHVDTPCVDVQTMREQIEIVGPVDGAGDPDDHGESAYQRCCHSYCCQPRPAASMPLTIRVRESSSIPLEVDTVRLDTVREQSADEVKRTLIQRGNQQVELGDFFDVDGSAVDDETLVWAGDCSRVKLIGEKLAGGYVRVEGDAGMHLGAEMTGGEIVVTGNSGDWTGAETSRRTHSRSRKRRAS